MPGAFDRNSNCTLVLGAGAGLAPRADLALTVDKAAEQLYVAVIDLNIMIRAELASARAGEIAFISTSGPSATVWSFVTHLVVLL